MTTGIMCPLRTFVPSLHALIDAKILSFRWAMDTIISIPGRAFDYVNGQYGTVGLIVIGLMVVVGIVGVLTWFDRRK